MPGSDGSQFIAMRKYGAANNPSVSSLKQPGSNRLILPKVSGTGLSREEFLPSISKLNRNISSAEVLLTVAPSLAYTSGSTVTFPPLPGATNYKLYNNSGNALILDLGTNTSFSIPSLINPPANLSPNTPYTVYVVGSNSLGPSPRSSTITFTTPPAPPTMTTSGTNLTIPSSTGATSYRLISSPPIVPQPTITPGTTSFSSLGLTPGTTYTLSVATTGANGIESLPGATVTVYTPPNPIQSVSYGASTSTTAVVSWAAPSVGGVTAYNIYDGSTLYARVASTTVTFGIFSGQPPLASGTTFTNFSVKAYYNTFNNESASVPLSFSTTAPITTPAPTNGVASTITSTAATLTWNAPTGNTPTGYNIYNGTTLYATMPGIVSTITLGSGSYAPLIPATTYSFNVKAYYGTVSTESSALNIPFSTFNTYPTASTFTIDFNFVTETGAKLNWIPTSGPYDGYYIYLYYPFDAAPSVYYKVPGITTSTFSPTGLLPGRLIYFEIRTYTGNPSLSDNPIVNNPLLGFSRIGSATMAMTTPLAPTNPIVSNLTGTGATLTWSPVTTPVGTNTRVYRYNIYNGTTFVTFVPSGTTTYNVTSLSPSTQYTFNVKAVGENRSGSGVSDKESASPLAFTFTTPLSIVRVTGFSEVNPDYNLSAVASDDTGQYILAVESRYNDGKSNIFTSKDFGVTWRINNGNIDVAGSPQFRWADCSVSADGERAAIVASESGRSGAYYCNSLKTQLNAGAGDLTWTLIGPSGDVGDTGRFNSVKISANGNRLYALRKGGGPNSGNLASSYVSSYISGANVWSQFTAFGTVQRDNWGAITCSADGRYVYAGPGVGGNNKSTYKYDSSTPATPWQVVDNQDYNTISIDCSDNGAIVYSMGLESRIRASGDYGVTWSTISGVNSMPLSRSLACNNDGSIVYAITAEFGRITKILNRDPATTTVSDPPEPIPSSISPTYENREGCNIACSADGSKFVFVTGNSKIFRTP